MVNSDFCPTLRPDPYSSGDLADLDVNPPRAREAEKLANLVWAKVGGKDM